MGFLKLTFFPRAFFREQRRLSVYWYVLLFLSFILPTLSHGTVFLLVWKQWIVHIRDAFQVLSDVLILSALPSPVAKLLSNPETLTNLEIKYVLLFFVGTVLILGLLRFTLFWLLLFSPLVRLTTKHSLPTAGDESLRPPVGREAFLVYLSAQTLWIWAAIPFLGLPLAWFLSFFALVFGLSARGILTGPQSILVVGVAAFAEALILSLGASALATFLIDLMYHYWPSL